jgi:hypothetical protein
MPPSPKSDEDAGSGGLDDRHASSDTGGLNFTSSAALIKRILAHDE